MPDEPENSDTDEPDQDEGDVLTRDDVDEVVNRAIEAAEERLGDNGEAMDEEQMRDVVRDVLEDYRDDASSTTDLNHDARDVSVGESRASSEDGCLHLTAGLYRAVLQGSEERQRDIQRQLFEAGHYDELNVEMRSEGFQTVVDEQGGVFIPTTVANRIYDIEDQVGAISSVATELPLEQGERRQFPQVLGTITFSAVNEFNEVTGQQFNLGSITLNAHKWAALVPWSNEMEETAGGQLLPIVNRKIAIGSAKFKDDVVLNGDGGSSYHGIKGIFQRAADGDITQRAADSGASSFSALTSVDWLKLQLALPASIRSQGVYVTHPDRRYDLLELADNSDEFHFYMPNTESNDLAVDRLWGRPIHYTDQHPNTDSTGEEYAAYFHPDFLAFGRSNSLSTKLLDQATIEDPDGNDLRLAASFAQALRVREDADFEFGLEDAFAEGQLA